MKKLVFGICFLVCWFVCVGQNITSDSVIATSHRSKPDNYIGPLILGACFLSMLFYIFLRSKFKEDDEEKFTSKSRIIMRITSIIALIIISGVTSDWHFSISFWFCFIPYTLLILILLYVTFWGSPNLKGKAEKYAPYIWLASILVLVPLVLFSDTALTTSQLILLSVMTIVGITVFYFKYIVKKKQQ